MSLICRSPDCLGLRFAVVAFFAVSSAREVVAQPTSSKTVVVRNEAGGVEVENGVVSARFVVRDDHVEQRYYAAVGGRWELIADSRVAAADLLPALYDANIDPSNRYLVPSLLQNIAVDKCSDDLARVVLRGENKAAKIEHVVELARGKNYFHHDVKVTLADKNPKVEYVLSPISIAIDGTPDFTHVPAFKPKADSVIGDRSFFAPAAIIQKGGKFAAVVPDLDLLNEYPVYAKETRPQTHPRVFAVKVDPAKASLPAILDIVLAADGGAKRPLLTFGFADVIANQHVWWRHDNTKGAMVRELASPQIRYSFDLFVSADASPQRGYQVVGPHLWKRYGTRHFREPRPQTMPYAEYAKICYPATFTYQGYDVLPDQQGLRNRNLPGKPEMETWRQWSVDDRPVGGLRLAAPQWFHLIAFSGWWNNCCDATGLFYWGTRQKDAGLTDKARAIVNLALSAPQKEGMFPAFYDLNAKRWVGSLWHPPIKGYNPSHSSAYWNWKDGAYQTAAASVTAGYLLEYRNSCENDPRILEFAQRYGDFLIARMDKNGRVPAWFSADLKPLPSLRWNADGGAHAWLLSELYRATKNEKYLEAAERAARFLDEEVLPTHRWVDFESLYSCGIKPETFHDDRTGQPPRCTISMSWALQGYLSLYEATGKARYLKSAEAVADFVGFYQAVWAPHYIVSAYPFGGITSQLGDAEWLDQRAHRFAAPLVRLGLLTGRQELIERGVAAGRSSLTLTTHPRHVANKVYPFADFPTGLGPENIDHEGFPQRPLSSGPSWSSVGGLAGISHLLHLLGGVYVDFEKNLAISVDGVRVKSFERDGKRITLELENQLMRLPRPYRESFEVEIRIKGLSEGRYELIVNGARVGFASQAELARYKIDVSPAW